MPDSTCRFVRLMGPLGPTPANLQQPAEKQQPCLTGPRFDRQGHPQNQRPSPLALGRAGPSAFRSPFQRAVTAAGPVRVCPGARRVLRLAANSAPDGLGGRYGFAMSRPGRSPEAPAHKASLGRRVTWCLFLVEDDLNLARCRQLGPVQCRASTITVRNGNTPLG